jgi:hypothetical protein
LSPNCLYELRCIDAMTTSTALKRYLGRHIEPNLPNVPDNALPWRNVLVIPVYAESPSLLERLTKSLSGPHRVLVILVLNRPETENDSQCNQELRQLIKQQTILSGTPSKLLKLNQYSDLYLYDMERISGPLSAKEGVGLARKVGCDIALSWWHCGYIETPWICSSDADATLPKDYFERLDSIPEKTAAATFPFKHLSGLDDEVTQATLLYELRLHHYVLGLDYAGSGYAHHTLGSALAIKCERYAQVRGFPKRAGGEDFYLLNKVAKTGPIERLSGHCIELESRTSNRVPFGTGPAVGKIIAAGVEAEQALFYHPQCFYALRSVLESVPALRTRSASELPLLLQDLLGQKLAQDSYEILVNLGIEKNLEHCIRQSQSEGQFTRQFHQWFDGFRTLKFIHGLRGLGWHNQTLSDLSTAAPNLWPVQSDQILEAQALRRAIQKNWGWSIGKEERSENLSRDY